MNKASDEEQLTKTHKVLLYMLIAFDKVCRENDLTYFLDSGTALGAVRHKGFIPWDDDADVGMPRKDYDRFLQIAGDILPDNLFLQTRETDPLYNRNAAKLRLKDTYIHEFGDPSYGHNGFFIDIFPFDNIPSNKYLARFNIITLGLIYRIIMSWRRSRRNATSTGRNIINKIIQIIPESLIECINGVHTDLCRRYENIDTGFITCHYWSMTYMNSKTYIFESSQIFPIKDSIFEGYLFQIPQNADYYLRIMYGDYMKLPPEDERYGRHSITSLEGSYRN